MHIRQGLVIYMRVKNVAVHILHPWKMLSGEGVKFNWLISLSIQMTVQVTYLQVEFYLLGYNAVQCVGSQPTFWRNMSPPSSVSKNKLHKIPAWKLVTPSSETSVNFQQITWRYIPESTLHNHRGENRKSNIFISKEACTYAVTVVIIVKQTA
jgi:hypothetical protein